MSVLLSTSGTLGTVTIGDLGGRSFVHPVTDLDISEQYTFEELRGSEDLGAALDSGYISIVNDGQIVGNSSGLKTVEPTVGENTGTFSSQQIFEGATIIAGGLHFANEYVTPLLTESNYSNYNIPNIESHAVIKWCSDTDVNIRSVAAPTRVDPSIDFLPIVFFNGNSNRKSIRFKRNATGDASNRFDITTDISVSDGEFWLFGYDFNVGKWRAQAKI